MKSDCIILKLLVLVLRVRWKVRMMAFNCRVFARCAVVYVEHILIPVPKLPSELKHWFVTTAQWHLRERDALPREVMPA